MNSRLSQISAELEYIRAMQVYYEVEFDLFPLQTRYNHNHGPDGKFTSGSGAANAVSSGAGVDNKSNSGIIGIKPSVKISMQFFAKKRRAVEPAPEDKPFLYKQINTLYHSRYEGKKTAVHYSANYKYKIKVNGYDDYVLLKKTKLK